MDRTRASYQKWSHARALVVHASQELARDFDNCHARADLRVALEAERKARQEFEIVLREEG